MLSQLTSPVSRGLPRGHSASSLRSRREPELPTFGVEEEFALLDPATGGVTTVGPAVVTACADAHGVVPEIMKYMVETRTPVSRSVHSLREALLARRLAVTREAARRGALVVASGAVPLGQPTPPPLTDGRRYHELAARFPGPVSTAGTLGCHVHVAVPTRSAAVEVLNRTRCWLPALIALTANSPITDGRDTGWASRRYRLAARWPTGCPALPVTTAAAYDDLVATAIATGDALDMRNVYFLIRLSPRYPTVEVRVADVQLTAEEAAAYAGLVRALIVQAVHDAADHRPIRHVDQAVLVSGCAAAARGGASGTAVDVATGGEARGWELIDELLRYVLPALELDRDVASVLSTVELIRLRGGGADRQRQLWREADSAAAFARALANWTTMAGRRSHRLPTLSNNG